MSKRVNIKAAPGRVILRFQEHPTEEVMMDDGLYRPAVFTQIPEIAEVVDVGEPLDAEERVYASYFLDCKARGQHVFADYGAGGTLFKERTDATKWGWLKPLRVYRLSSPSAHLELVDVEETA
jgi:hypothetical protein